MIELGDRVRYKTLSREGKHIMTVTGITYRKLSKFNDIPYIDYVECEYELKCGAKCVGRYSPEILRKVR